MPAWRGLKQQEVTEMVQVLKYLWVESQGVYHWFGWCPLLSEDKQINTQLALHQWKSVEAAHLFLKSDRSFGGFGVFLISLDIPCPVQMFLKMLFLIFSGLQKLPDDELNVVWNFLFSYVITSQTYLLNDLRVLLTSFKERRACNENMHASISLVRGNYSIFLVLMLKVKLIACRNTHYSGWRQMALFVLKDTWKEFYFCKGKKVLQGKVLPVIAFPFCIRWLFLKQGSCPRCLKKHI